jgi:hypothetical protein
MKNIETNKRKKERDIYMLHVAHSDTKMSNEDSSRFITVLKTSVCVCILCARLEQHVMATN